MSTDSHCAPCRNTVPTNPQYPVGKQTRATNCPSGSTNRCTVHLPTPGYTPPRNRVSTTSGGPRPVGPFGHAVFLLSFRWLPSFFLLLRLERAGKKTTQALESATCPQTTAVSFFTHRKHLCVPVHFFAGWPASPHL